MANDYTLITDSSCDLPPDYLRENGIPDLQLYFTIGDVTRKCNEMTPEEFYRCIRGGDMPVTSQVNVEDAVELFEEEIGKGRDILYLAFSSGLSGTYNSGCVAAELVRKKFPDCRIIVVDTLCASMGQGLYVYEAQQMKAAGCSIDEVAQWASDNVQRVAHYVLADDLHHLHRGGRVSKTSAMVGQMLGIKPIIQVNREGKLAVYDKVRGRKQAISKCVEHLVEAVGDTKGDMIMISHADCEEDARYAAELIKKRTGIKNSMIYYMGPVIGAHTGTEAIGMFLMADHR